ncbi:SoxR reducing system RseC family protein [Gilvimarinus sp. SDUM040013]|uniref:SoxR reducing system RseC family protein n=1 Tax=Gilvimarinus gilvus TaxID=3058038 RepID=A0ABU4RS92_9GAMM|nr:SoxR reducing system RseC family protein [Gilvimarinus sp. SDUM040013]MDO3388205.1 SoxR reducing system RseC family protein [Gilvimarinus sp. SDUM040013]MDX6847755.1 SoxR reducing system RseC family protein [Gilvimarinus sp. SDUM040013]
MLIETGKVVAVESDGLWVETISRSTCGSCAAQKGCGQSLLAKLAGHTTYLWVSLGGRNSADYQVGDDIELGVPEAVVANGSLLVYLLPLITLLGFTLAASELGWGEGATTLAGLFGLVAGGALVRWRAHVTRHDSRLQPVLVDDQQVVSVS